MPILDEVSAQLKDAMRSRDKARLGALRGLRAALIHKMKEDGAESLDDDVCIQVLRRQAKQRLESIDAFEAAGREAQAAAERAELSVIESFLPSLADADLTREWVREAISTTGATSPKQLGRVMGSLMKAHKDEVDGKLARQLASELLAGG